MYLDCSALCVYEVAFIYFTFIYLLKILPLLNKSYLTDSYIGFTLKMESVSKNTIFGLKMMVKSGLEKIILKSLHGKVVSRMEELYFWIQIPFWG